MINCIDDVVKRDFEDIILVVRSVALIPLQGPFYQVMDYERNQDVWKMEEV